MQARALGPLKAQTKPAKFDVQTQQKNFEDSEDNDEEKVQTVDQERRRSTEFVGDANVEPVGQLNLDDAHKAKIPHFLSAWFNTGEKKTAKDPNASIALVPALALDETSSPMDIAMLQSNPELSVQLLAAIVATSTTAISRSVVLLVRVPSPKCTKETGAARW